MFQDTVINTQCGYDVRLKKVSSLPVTFLVEGGALWGYSLIG